MHASSHRAADPFGMLVDPQAVIRALEGSQRLECLNRRVCRPLDRMPPPKPGTPERDAYDRAAERAPDLSVEE
jgi:hypothetical protein